MIGLMMMLAAAPDATARNLFSGNALYESCTGLAVDRVECQGFVQGAIAAETYFEEAKAIRPLICYPNGLQGQQLIEIVVDHLRNHPETRQNGAGGLVIAALQNVFPCPRR